MAFEREFTCKYCHRVFVREHHYLNHKCKQMKHLEELQSPVGQAAWLYYQTWFRMMKKIPPRAEAFLASRYFRTFINVATFIQRVDLPRPEKFIRLMVERDYTPIMWTMDETYALYMEYLEYNTTPLEQVQLSIDTLFAISEKHDIDVADVFTVITPLELIHLIRSRKLSPWVLLLSKKFKEYFVTRVTPEQRNILETLIRPDSWAARFGKSKEVVDGIKQCVRELNL